MKKLIALLLVLLLLPVTALAEETEEGDILITLDDGTTVFFTPLEDSGWVTRKSAPARFLSLGLDYREMIPFMEEYAVHMLMYDAEETSEIQVSAYPCTDGSLRDMTAAEQEAFCAQWVADFQEAGYEVLDCEIRTLPSGGVFIRTLASATYEDGWTDYLLEYVTIVDGWTVGFHLFSYLEGVVQEQVALLETVAATLVITPAE